MLIITPNLVYYVSSTSLLSFLYKHAVQFSTRIFNRNVIRALCKIYLSDTTQFVVGKVAITKKIKLHTISIHSLIKNVITAKSEENYEIMNI